MNPARRRVPGLSRHGVARTYAFWEPPASDVAYMGTPLPDQGKRHETRDLDRGPGRCRQRAVSIGCASPTGSP
jgi:hypothetical protein